MKFEELDEILQLRLKKSCRLYESLNDWLPSNNDTVVLENNKVVSISTSGKKLFFKDNNITSLATY